MRTNFSNLFNKKSQPQTPEFPRGTTKPHGDDTNKVAGTE